MKHRLPWEYMGLKTFFKDLIIRPMLNLIMFGWVMVFKIQTTTIQHCSVKLENLFLKYVAGAWPDLNRAYFWPAVNKRPYQVLFELTDWDFLDQRAKNGKIWDFKGKFSKPKPKSKMADPTQPGLSNKKLTPPR